MTEKPQDVESHRDHFAELGRSHADTDPERDEAVARIAQRGLAKLAGRERPKLVEVNVEDLIVGDPKRKHAVLIELFDTGVEGKTNIQITDVGPEPTPLNELPNWLRMAAETAQLNYTHSQTGNVEEDRH